ncbi:MAG: DUF3016 domain-containing protein [Janthinobacterium sp.]
MQTKIPRLLIAGLALLASSAAWAGTEVHFNKPEQFTDLPFDQRQREDVLKELTAHFDKLGRALPAGQTLKIEVSDIDLAGREQPRMHGMNDLRILNGGVDWPHMRLHYALEQDGKVISSGDAALSDMSYMNRINRYASNEKLRYEKLMIDDWFAQTFGVQAKRQAKR